SDNMGSKHSIRIIPNRFFNEKNSRQLQRFYFFHRLLRQIFSRFAEFHLESLFFDAFLQYFFDFFRLFMQERSQLLCSHFRINYMLWLLLMDGIPWIKNGIYSVGRSIICQRHSVMVIYFSALCSKCNRGLAFFICP